MDIDCGHRRSAQLGCNAERTGLVRLERPRRRAHPIDGERVFRSTWERPVGVWYSAVWAHGRPIFLIEDNGQRFTAVDSGTSYPAARRSPLRIRTQFSDSGLSIRATSNGAVTNSATGTLIASTYSVANQRPDTDTGDHTVVITVPNAIPMRLGLLTLSYATYKHPYIEVQGNL